MNENMLGAGYSLPDRLETVVMVHMVPFISEIPVFQKISLIETNYLLLLREDIYLDNIFGMQFSLLSPVAD